MCLDPVFCGAQAESKAPRRVCWRLPGRKAVNETVGCCGRAARRASGIAYNCRDRCGAGRGVWSSKDTRRLTGLFWQCATRDTRRLVLPGKMHKTGIGILSGCGPGRPLLPLPSLAPEAVSRCPAFGSCRPRALRTTRSGAGRDKGCALCGPAGRDRIAHRHRRIVREDQSTIVDDFTLQGGNTDAGGRQRPTTRAGAPGRREYLAGGTRSGRPS